MKIRRLMVAAALVAVALPTQSLAADPVTLTVMHWGNQGDAWWQQRITDFTAQYPNVTIKQEIVPYGQYADKLGAYKTAGSGPDVMQMTSGAYLLGFSDMLMPLNGLDLTAYNGAEASCEDFDCTKTVYGLPWAAQGHPLYYNKAVLTAAGLDPNTPPLTWKDMDAACTKIKAIGKACIAAGPKDYGGLTELGGALLNQTASIAECQGLHTGASHGTDPWFVNAFALWADMVKRGWFQDGVADANLAPEAQDLFTSGGSGFYTGLMGDAYDWKHIGAAMKNPADLGVYLGPQIEQDFPLPGVGPGELSTSIDSAGGTSFTVAKSTKAPTEAVAFAKFMTGPETAAAVTEAGSYPASKAFDSSAIGSPALDQLVAMAGQSKGACWQYLDAPVFDAIIAQTQLLLAGQSSPEAAGQAVEDSLIDVRP